MVSRVPRSGSALTNTVAVTGAGGYLGGLLVDHLIDAQHLDVRALSRTPAPWLPIPATALELTDRDALEAAFAGASAVVHLAGANEAIAKDDPDRALAETVIAAHRVAEASAAVGVSRVVYVSTVHIYGAALQPGARITEDVVPQPRSVYAVARLAAEHLLASAESGDLVVVRLTNAVGAPAAAGVDRWSLVANDLCRQVVLTGELRLRSDGRQWRDFVALADVVRIVGLATDPHALPSGTYNLGSSQPVTILQLAEMVQDAAEALTGTRPPLHVAPPQREQAAPYIVSTDRLGAQGLHAEVPVRDAIAETLRFCSEQKADLESEDGR